MGIILSGWKTQSVSVMGNQNQITLLNGDSQTISVILNRTLEHIDSKLRALDYLESLMFAMNLTWILVFIMLCVGLILLKSFYRKFSFGILSTNYIPSSQVEGAFYNVKPISKDLIKCDAMFRI